SENNREGSQTWLHSGGELGRGTSGGESKDGRAGVRALRRQRKWIKGMKVTAPSAELPVRSYQLIGEWSWGGRTTANRESRIVEAMKKPRPTTAATTTECNKPEVRHGESVLPDQRSEVSRSRARGATASVVDRLDIGRRIPGREILLRHESARRWARTSPRLRADR